MTRARRNLSRIFSLLLLALATSSAQAADDYLKVIPSTALSFGAVNHMNEVSDKIKKLATLVQVPATSMLETIKKEAGISKGLDEKGAAGFFVLPGKTEKDAVAVVYFLAVADEEAFRGNFEVVKAGERISEVKPKPADEIKPKPADAAKLMPPMPQGAIRNTPAQCLSFRNGYALLSSKADRAALEAAVEAKQDISAEIAGMESWLAENDGIVAVTTAGIKYAAKKAHDELKKSKENFAPGIGMPGPAAVLYSYLELYGKALEAAPRDISLALAGIGCDKEGSIRIVGRARLAQGGDVSKAVADIPPVTENLLSGVPGGPFVFAAGGISVPKLAEGCMDMTLGLMKTMKSDFGMSAEDMQRMSKESLAVFRQVRSMTYVMKTGRRGDPIFSNVFGALRTENPRRILALQEKYVDSANKLLQSAKPGGLKSITAKRLEIGGKPALQEELNFDLSSLAGTAGAEAERAMLDEMIGVGGKMLLYCVAADEHTLLMGIGVSQDRMAAALEVIKQPRKSFAEDADASVTAAMLPAKSQWVAYLSPRGYMQLTQRLMSAALKNNPAGFGFTMPEFPRCPPIGFALGAMPTELHAEIAVPSALVQAAGEYMKEMQKMIMNQMMQQKPTPQPAP